MYDSMLDSVVDDSHDDIIIIFHLWIHVEYDYDEVM